MTNVNLDHLLSLLNEARQKGCTNVKLQLFEKWEDVVEEQKNPKHELDAYKIDSRFYNTIEFETEIVNLKFSDKLITFIDGVTFIIRVHLSDRESLLRNLTLSEFYN